MTRIGAVLFVAATLVACGKSDSKKSESHASAARTTPSATRTKGQTFGAGVKLPSSTPISSILAEPKKFSGQTVRVEGMITDVCEMRGCWFEMAGEKPGEKLRFKVTDGEMVFPMESKGKHAVAEGVLVVKDLSLEDTRALEVEDAKEKGKELDPATVTTPKSIVRLDGTGAVFEGS